MVYCTYFNILKRVGFCFKFSFQYMMSLTVRVPIKKNTKQYNNNINNIMY